VPSHSMSWATMGAWARPVTVPGHVEACGLRPELLGTVWPSLTHVFLARELVCINFIGRGGNPLLGVGWRGAGSLGVERGGERGPGVG
jgi:hypothetical protein